MSNITYKALKPKGGIYREGVYVDGKKSGEIQGAKYAPGFQYFPNGKKSGGKVFPNIQQLKNDLENE